MEWIVGGWRYTAFALFAGLGVACGVETIDEIDEPIPVNCGNGEIDEQEACDGTNLNGMNCAKLDVTKPLGELACTRSCRWDTSSCFAFADTDNDTVQDHVDLDPTDPYVCRDGDEDGCDDCSLLGRADTAQDGFDPDGDGICSVTLDPDCANGANADRDPLREVACLMFDLINQDRRRYARESSNALPLQWNEDIWEVAVAHSQDMCDRRFFDHVNPDRQDPSARAREAGLNYGLGENIVRGYPTAYQGQYAFMNEPTCRGHRANILNPRYTQAAVGYVRCSQNGQLYATQNFRSGRSSSWWCDDGRNHCSVPPNPPSVAGEHESCVGCSVIDLNHPQFIRYCP